MTSSDSRETEVEPDAADATSDPPDQASQVPDPDAEPEAEPPDGPDAPSTPPDEAEGAPPEPAPGPDSGTPARRRRSNRGAYVLIGLAVLGLIAVNVVRWVTDAGDDPDEPTADTVAEFDPSEAVPRPTFTLIDVDGQPYDFSAATGGQLTFLFFGYTSCPDICPIQMATLSATLADMPRVSAEIIFVTTDPARDTPERLRTWLGGFDRPITGLTGTVDELTAAQKAARVSTAIADEPDSTGRYNVGHAASVLIYTPDNVLRASVPAGTTQAEWMSIITDITGPS